MSINWSIWIIRKKTHESIDIAGGVYNDTNQVKISNCDNTLPCVLKKQTTATIEQRFSPTHDVKKLYKNVLAKIDLITLPFFGVDGTDACGEIFNLDGSKAGCPLVKDQEYIYRNQFDILQLYPTVSGLSNECPLIN